MFMISQKQDISFEIQNEKNKKIFYAFWIFTLIVILWGAWVRISNSGDGCGDHWPLCTGEVIPELGQRKTFIEFFHRLMTGTYGLIVVYFYFTLRKYPYVWVRRLNLSLLLLMICEALIGALLVKLKLVSVNDSFLRLFFMSLHQLSSFLLTGVTYYLTQAFNPDFKIQFFNKKWILFLIVSVSGAIAALSTTLFPSISLWQGVLADFSTDSHIFVRLRILHPLLATVIMLGLVIYFYLKNNIRLSFEILAAVFIGLITLVTLSPVYLKLVHLALAHYLWTRFLKSELA